MKLLWIVLLLSIISTSCSTVKGNINLSRNDKGEITNVDYSAKGTVDFVVEKDKVEVKTKKIPKPSFLDKATDLATIGFTNRALKNEDD